MVSKIAIFTVALAQTKACCGPRHGVVSGLDDDFLCIASDCMAWRWYETHIKGPDGDLVLNGETYGYCGLSGSPVPKGGA